MAIATPATSPFVALALDFALSIGKNSHSCCDYYYENYAKLEQISTQPLIAHPAPDLYRLHRFGDIVPPDNLRALFGGFHCNGY